MIDTFKRYMRYYFGGERDLIADPRKAVGLTIYWSIREAFTEGPAAQVVKKLKGGDND